MARWLYYVVEHAWVARLSDDGLEAQLLMPDGIWAPISEVGKISADGRQVASEEEALEEAREMCELRGQPHALGRPGADGGAGDADKTGGAITREVTMANEEPTGVLFRSKLGPFEKMPEFDWRLGDSDQYRYYYVRGTRADGLKIAITPEEEAGEYHVGVYFTAMAVFPECSDRVAVAQRIHEDVLSLIEGVRENCWTALLRVSRNFVA